MVFMVQGGGAGFKHVANVWLELSLNPPRHRAAAWESLANVQRGGGGVFTALACRGRLRCVNMDGT